ncbi:uncharacterized protein LOC116122954 [Pistacia vera]|uniref:uncharacterized protein LOC116122954 n=1 Tax=Pistacia vera TaxID=55513 RepID=UPI001263CFD4|nr:uncharacterized protein LOC116122954 [Pistacia vera]
MDVHTSNFTTLDVLPALPSISVKLLEKNYSFWRSQILLPLTSHGLEGFVSGEKECPPMFVFEKLDESGQSVKKPNPSYFSWKKVDQFLFQSVSKARTLHLRNLLQTTKKKACSVSEYVLKVTELGDELVASGVNLTDEELVLYILDGLGPKYDAMVANLVSTSS